MKTLFIVNPAAGHGSGAQRWKRAAGAALARHPGSEAWTTRAPGHGSELARRGIEAGFEAIIAVGGDGTLGEVVDGWFSVSNPSQRAVLGTWPVGSGCDFARHFGIKPEGDWLVSALDGRRTRPLDAGKVTFVGTGGSKQVRYFLNIAAFGLAGDVALRVQTKGKPWGGTLSYMIDSIAVLLTAKARRMELVVDGVAEPARRYHLITLANTSTFGGGMRVAPGADPEDGLLDLVTVGDLTRVELLRRFPLIYGGRHLGLSGIEHRAIRRLEARSDAPSPLNIDGDLVGSLPATFEVLPRAVPFLCPNLRH